MEVTEAYLLGKEAGGKFEVFSFQSAPILGLSVQTRTRGTWPSPKELVLRWYTDVISQPYRIN